MLSSSPYAHGSPYPADYTRNRPKPKYAMRNSSADRTPIDDSSSGSFDNSGLSDTGAGKSVYQISSMQGGGGGGGGGILNRPVDEKGFADGTLRLGQGVRSSPRSGAPSGSVGMGAGGYLQGSGGGMGGGGGGIGSSVGGAGAQGAGSQWGQQQGQGQMQQASREQVPSARRNRSASRQSGGRSRRYRGEAEGQGSGGGVGGGGVEGPVLPQISGMSAGGLPHGIAGGGGVGGLGASIGPSSGLLVPAGRRQQQQHHHGGPSTQQQSVVVPAGMGADFSSSSSSSGGGGGGSSSSGATATAATVLRDPIFQGLTVTGEDHTCGAVTSIKGLKPGNPSWINQDNFFVAERFENRDVNLYCVLDGHGENGHLVSRKCRESFTSHIKSSNLDMRRAFGLMQNELLSTEFDVRCSGATCTLAMVAGGRLAVSNCGDSRAVLGRRNPSGALVAHALSNDHKPDRAEERKRILAAGGHVGCRHAVVNQPGKGPVQVPVGPCRVWYQHGGDTLGLAMSRSLGDSVVHRCGVSAEPETLEHIIDDLDEFVLIATDGVWDVLDNNQAVQLVSSAARSSNWSPMEASATVVKFARSRWEKLSPMIDDITCIVINLKKHT